MPFWGPSARRARRSAALAGLLALCGAGVAHADITGTVRTPAGAPVPGLVVEATSANGITGWRDNTDSNGHYNLASSRIPPGALPPFAISTATQTCRTAAQGPAMAASGPVPNGATVDLTMDVQLVCQSRATGTSPTGNVWPERGLLLAPPGGTFALDYLAPFEGSDFAFHLGNAVLGTSTQRLGATFTAPTTPGGGPLTLTWSQNGAGFSRPLGTLVVLTPTRPAPAPGSRDLAVVLDTSGSIRFDQALRVDDAVAMLGDLAGRGDRLQATTFADQASTLIPRTTIAGAASRAAVRRLAHSGGGNMGGTNFNAGLAAAFDGLSAAPSAPAVPKSAIFVTDGGHNVGDYLNAHLRFADNGTGRDWPICVVQLGTAPTPDATPRLKRIATETAGLFQQARTGEQVKSAFFDCTTQAVGGATLLRRPAGLRVRQARTYSRRVRGRPRSVTFFTSSGAGTLALRLTAPGGRVFTRSAGSRVRFVRGTGHAFFQVTTPRAGVWRLKVTRLVGGPARTTAITTIATRPR